MELNEIRDDLKEIRYYYSRKFVFDGLEKNITNNAIQEKIDKYNCAMRVANVQLFDIYISLYLQNNTQESLAETLGYSVEYVSRLNKRLLTYLFEHFNEQ